MGSRDVGISFFYTQALLILLYHNIDKGMGISIRKTMKLALIGKGAIAHYVKTAATQSGHVVAAILVRPESVYQNPSLYVDAVMHLPDDIDLVIECAGHQALSSFGPDILSRGINLITVSIGALADEQVLQNLENAAILGKSKLLLASGAIGSLDCLKAATTGKLQSVSYVGRKPPNGWKGSAAESTLDLNSLKEPQTHFEGSARQAALEYPQNANVAAAVALAGLGMDHTKVCLIADPTIEQNIHQIKASGDFGQFMFQIQGNSLPDNPRSSALAAMSVVAKLDQLNATIEI